MTNWLELELAEKLAPVEAPDELWHRIQTGRRIPARRPVPLILAAAALLAGVLLLAIPAAQRPPTDRPAPNADRPTCFLCHSTL